MISNNLKVRPHASARIKDVCSHLYLNKIIKIRLEGKTAHIFIEGGTGKEILC